MEKAKFIEILTEAGVPPEYHNTWWKHHKNDNGSFSLNYSREELLLNVKMVVEKGRATSAPW